MIQLRDYQEQGVTEIRNAMINGNRRICYTGPCGAGKTVLFSYMAINASLQGKRTLILVHRVELLDQAAETLQESGVHFGIIAAGKPMTNDLIQLTSVQTISRRLDKIPPPDLIISDEFHHAVANTWVKIFNYFPNAYVVGLTATPCRLNGQGLGEVADILIEGPTAKTLISRKYLTSYKYYAPPQVFDMDGVTVKMGDYDQKQLAEKVDKPTIIGNALQHYEKLAKGKSTIIYCASIDHSIHTVEIFKNAGYTAAHLDGKTNKYVRKKITDDFKTGKLQIISNCDIVSEGYNCPGAEVVMLLRPTASLVLFIQQSMRCLRLDKNNPDKVGIIIDAVGNVARHGLPDEEHIWTLESKKKKSAPREVMMKICPKCYGAHNPSPVCPYCQHIYQVAVQAAIDEKAGELTEILELKKKEKKQEVGRARNVVSLEQIAMQRGYAPGWIRKMCELKRIPFGAGG